MKKSLLLLFALLCFFTDVEAQFSNSKSEPPVVLMGDSEEYITSKCIFKDDGGDSSYSSRENTTICFKPQTPGAKIKVVFSEFNVEANSTCKYDFLEIYNGNSASADKFGKFCGTDSPGTFVSTAADGALFFKFISDTSGNRDGWVAAITEYMPKDMEYQSIELSQDNLGLMPIGAQNQDIIRVNIKTTGSLNPISLNSIIFNTTGTSLLTDISKAKLYYTTKPKFNTDILVAELDNATAEINFVKDQFLVEGDNYFFLAYDVSSLATAENVMDAGFVSATIAGEEKTEAAANPAGNRVLKEIILASEGTHNYTITKPVLFADDGGIDGNVTEGLKDIIYLTPNSAKEKVQVDFSELKFNTMRIFNGKSTDTKDQILYVSASTKPQLVKSTSDDGCLTIKVDSKSYGDYKGWVATISNYTPKPMEYVSSELEQISPKSVAPSDKNIGLFKLNITTQYLLAPRTLNSVKLRFTDATNISDISNVKIYYDKILDEVPIKAENLVATVSEINSKLLTIPLNKELIKGDRNRFKIAIDIAPSAADGNSIEASIESVVFNNIAHSPETTDYKGSIGIKNMYIIKPGENEYTVNNDIKFYDHGGPDANYTKNFDGTITFKPANANDKVKIKFNSFSTYYSHKLVVYNGNNTSAPELGQFSGTDTPEELKSTSLDGCLTFKFYVSTYSYSFGAGWDAIVSTYTPEPMQLTSIEAFQNNTDVLESGSKKQELIGFKITAKGILNPKKIENLNLDFAGTTDLSDISNLKIYYSKENDFDSNSKIEIKELASLSSHKNSIILNKLIEVGENYFWLSIDINESAGNNNKIDAQIENITISGTEQIPNNNNPEGSRTIKNFYKMSYGSKEVITDGGVFFDDGGDEYTYSDDMDATMVFKPKTAGNKIKVEFVSFVLQNKSYSGSFNDYLAIYDGNSTSANEIGKYAGTDIPPVIVSTAIDGSLCFKFESDYYTEEAGWKAIISEYTPKPMKIAATTSLESTIGSASIGEKGVVVAGLNIQTKDMLNPISVQKFKIDTRATQNINKILIYSTANSNLFNKDNLVAEADYASNIQELSLTYKLSSGNNYFWICYDVSHKAAKGDLLKAEFIEFTEADKKHNISTINPKAIVVKDIIKMPLTTGNVYVIDKPIKFTDDGGEENTFNVDFNSSVHFVPANADQKVRIDFTEFELPSKYGATLTAYNGLATDGSNTIAQMYGEEIPAPVKSTADDGALRVFFKPNSSYTAKEGWVATVSLYNPRPLFVEKTITSQADRTFLERNTEDQLILKTEVKISGEKDKINLEKLVFSMDNCTNSNDILKAKLYYTNGLDKFTTGELLSEIASPSGDLVFPISKEITREKSVYFWLCYDIANDAKVNDIVDARFIAITAGGKTQDVLTGDPIGKRVIRGPLDGSYTVNPDVNVDADFVSPADAMKALSVLGVLGKVNFKIADGEYKGALTLNEVAGVSNENTITFEPAVANSDKVIFSFDGKIVEPTLLTINGADFVTFKNFTFKANATRYGRLVEYYNEANNLSFVNNKFIGIQTISSDIDHEKTLVYCADTKHKSIDHNAKFIGNSFTYGNVALYLAGDTYVTDFETGTEIKDNIFTNQYFMSLYLMYQNDISIDGNSFILNDARRENWTLRLFKNKKNCKIINNKFNLEFNSRGGRAMMLQGMESIENSRALIANNMIYAKSTGSAIGISLEDGKSVDIAHNTIKLDGTGKYSRAFMYDMRGKTPVFDDVNIVNNIFSVYSSSYIIWSKMQAVNSNIDHNNYYTSDNSQKMFYYGSTNVKSLEEWKLANPSDSHSISVSPNYTSERDLHISGTDMKFGKFFARVSKDMDGQTRNAATPFMGADEIPDATFAGGYPMFTDITAHSAKMKLKSTIAGTVYYILLNSDEKLPSRDQIINGKNANNEDAHIKGSIALDVDIEKTIELSKLNEKNDYSVVLVLDKTVGDYSSILRLQFSTLDITPPVFEEDTPSLISVSDNSLGIKLKINELGTIYYALCETQVELNTSKEVKNGTNSLFSGKINSLNQDILEIKNLSPGTNYNFYAVAEDAVKNHNLQDKPSLITVKTLYGNSISNFSAESLQGKKAKLTWTQPENPANLMIVCSEDNIFGIPESGKTYTVNEAVSDGGKVVYLGNDSEFVHKDLESEHKYYYRAYTYNNEKEYSQYVEDFVVMSYDKWTILVYLDADNNLEPNGIADINEMESVDLPDDVNIIVQIDRNPGYDYSNGNWTDTRRYEIRHDNDAKKINSIRIDEANPLGELNMGDPKTLSDFVEFGMKAYPSEKTMLIMWDHGGGWRNDEDAKFAINKGVCWDDSNGNDYLEMREVKSAIEKAKNSVNRKLNVLGYDVCLAGMMEVAYELKNQVKDNFVFSQALVPGNGWNYQTWLENLKANPNLTAEELSISAASTFKENYQSKANVTMSVFDIDKTQELTESINEFVSQYTSVKVESAVINSAFNVSDLFEARKNYIDLGLFFDYCSKNLKNEDTKAKAKNVVDKLNETILYAGNTGSYARATGLNIYFHKYTDYEWVDYKAPYCDFADESYWKLFVENYDKDGLAPSFIDAYPKVANLSANVFDISIKSNKKGLAYYVVLDSDAKTPTKTQVKEGRNPNNELLSDKLKGELAVEKYTEINATVSKLKSNTDYFVYIILEDENGVSMDNPIKLKATTLGRKVATLESLPVANEAFYNGADNRGGFTDGGFFFPTYYSSSYWNGFGYSNRTDSSVEGMAGQFSSITGNGAEGSRVYGVSYVYGKLSRLSINDAGNGVPVTGIYVTNNTYAYYSMKKGDQIAKKFGGKSGDDKDWFKLTIKGIDAQGHYTGTVDFYLADFRFDDNSKDFIVKSWEWVDLRALGNVTKLEFRMSSSDTGSAGMNTPGYFCFDNLNGVAPNEMPPSLAKPIADIKDELNADDRLIDLSSVFAYSGNKDVIYTVEENTNADLVNLQISDNSLRIQFAEGKIGSSNIRIKAEVDGEFVEDSFTVTIVQNDNPPIVRKAIEDKTIYSGQKDLRIDLSKIFYDEDNDEIQYSVSSDLESKLSIEFDNDIMIITPLVAEAELDIVLIAKSNSKSISTNFNLKIVDKPLGINNIKKVETSVYPNPCVDVLNIKSKSRIEEVQLFSTTGVMVYNKKYNSNSISINITSLDLGSYILRIKTQDGNISQRILKI